MALGISLSCSNPRTHDFCTDAMCQCPHHTNPDWEPYEFGGPVPARPSQVRNRLIRKPGTSRHIPEEDRQATPKSKRERERRKRKKKDE